MSFAAINIRREGRVLQESSKLNPPATEKTDGLKTSQGGGFPVKPASTSRDVRDTGEQSVSGQQGISCIASFSSTEAILKRSLKNVSRALPVRQTLTSKLRQQKANPLLHSASAFTPAPLSSSTPLMRRATLQMPQPALVSAPLLHRHVSQSEARPSRLSHLPSRPSHVLSRPSSVTARPQKENRRPAAAPSKTMPPPFPLPKTKVFNRKQSQFQPALASQNTVPPQLSQARQPVMKPKAPVNAGASGRVPPAPKETKRIGAVKPALKSKATHTQNKPAPSVAPAATPQPKFILRRQSKSADNLDAMDGSHARGRVLPAPKETKRIAAVKPAVKPKTTPTQNKPAASVAPAATPQPKSILRRRSKSADNLDPMDGSYVRTGNGLSIVSKSMNKSLKSVAFYSPLNTAFPSPKISNTPPPSVLRERLENWLKKRGKSNYSYRHLCCFGLNGNAAVVGKLEVESPLDETITLEESSPDVDAPTVEETEQLLCAPQGSSTPEKQEAENQDEKAADNRIFHPGALHDLQQLIHSGYPRDQCEQWLALIVRSHPAAKDEFLYWECLAALEEARGDLGGAVDCLGRAIEQGADATAVDARLDALWERFCALGSCAPPTPSGGPNTPSRRSRRRAPLDPKHIFKSTVIRFALQRKVASRRQSGSRGGWADPKKQQQQEEEEGERVRFVVTPVRRSSRRSTSAFRSSEGQACVASLKDLSPTVQQGMSFQGNALLDPNT